jgi:hypothetical protein
MLALRSRIHGDVVAVHVVRLFYTEAEDGGAIAPLVLAPVVRISSRTTCANVPFRVWLVNLSDATVWAVPLFASNLS